MKQSLLNPATIAAHASFNGYERHLRKENETLRKGKRDVEAKLAEAERAIESLRREIDALRGEGRSS